MTENEIIDHQTVARPIHNNHIALMALLLGPFAGARYTHINSFIHLGKNKARMIYLIELILIVALIKIIPERSNILIAGIILTHIILALIVIILDRLINVESIKEYEAQGNPYLSLRQVFKVGLPYLFMYLAIITAFNLESIYTKAAIAQYEKHNGIVFYEKNIDLKRIDKIADAMKNAGYFNEMIKSSLTVVYRNESYLAIFSFYKADIEGTHFKAYVDELKIHLEGALNPEKVKVIIVDENKNRQIEL